MTKERRDKADSTDDRPLEQKLLTWLHEQGYPLEVKIARALRTRDWSVSQERAFRDPQTDTLRQADIVARVSSPRTPPSPPASSVNLVVECKRAKLPWIVFVAPAAHVPGNVMPGLGAVDRFSRTAMWMADPEITSSVGLLQRPNWVGYGAVSGLADRGTEGNPLGPYSALRSAVAAAQAFSAEVLQFAEEWPQLGIGVEIYLPVVVLEGRLFTYGLDSTGKEFLEEETRAKVAVPSPGDWSCEVPILTAEAFTEFLDKDTATLISLATNMAEHQAAIWRVGAPKREPVVPSTPKPTNAG